MRHELSTALMFLYELLALLAFRVWVQAFSSSFRIALLGVAISGIRGPKMEVLKRRRKPSRVETGMCAVPESEKPPGPKKVA